MIAELGFSKYKSDKLYKIYRLYTSVFISNIRGFYKNISIYIDN